MRHEADGVTSPPKEGVLRIFLSPSAGFEPANLGSNVKHRNDFTTEDDVLNHG
jgi:hypothetical protein